MKKKLELNQEHLRKKFIPILESYLKDKKITTEMKEIVKDYNKARELLNDSLNICVGIFEALNKGELKGKEAEQICNEILKELKSKTYIIPRDDE